MTVLSFAFTWLGRILALTVIAAALLVAYCAVLQWVIERADRKRRQAADVELARGRETAVQPQPPLGPKRVPLRRLLLADRSRHVVAVLHP